MFGYILPDDNESFDLLVNTKMRIVADVQIHFSWGWKIKPFLIVNFLTTQTTVGIGFYYLIKKLLSKIANRFFPNHLVIRFLHYLQVRRVSGKVGIINDLALL